MRLQLELGLDVALGEARAELREVGVVFALDGGGARGEGAAEVGVGVRVGAGGTGGGATVAAVVLVVAGFEVGEALVLAVVELGLLALLDDAVVEVDAGGEGAGDGGDEGGEDEALLGGGQ